VIRDPKLRAAFMAAYRAWLARSEQLSLFEDVA
jgi:hypothetical protein